MYKPLYLWDLYTISTESSPIHGIMLRGRIRKFCLQKERNVLVENASDEENVVRLAVPSGEDVNDIKTFLQSTVQDLIFEIVQKEIKNPILTKLKVNIKSRYTI